MSENNSSQTFDYDLVVIGGGSGGVRCARMSASYGAKVAIIESRYWGGTCVNVGCVPKKLYYYASHFSEAFEDARGFGWEVDTPRFDWSTLKDNRRQEIARLNGAYTGLLDNAGVDVIDGHGRLLDAHTVEVSEPTQLAAAQSHVLRNISARYILLATGAWPYVPEFPGAEHVVTSNEVFDLPQFPRSMLIVGGGYIALEFAGIFNGLGADTHLVYRGDKLLRHFDESLRTVITEEVAAKGVKLLLNSTVQRVDKRADGRLAVSLGDGETVLADTVLYATGRKPNFYRLGLENVSVKLTERGVAEVGEFYQTSEPSIFALGDIIHTHELTPVALAEGMVLARHLFDGGSEPMDYANVATAVFSQPTIAGVGLNEAQARAQYSSVRVFETRFRHMKNTLGGSNTKTYMKVIVDVPSDRVLGMHMIGDEAGEIIQGMAVAMNAGLTKRVLDNTLGIHPTAAEEFVTLREPVR
jgi:glutathione reductase (NADPH)